MDFQLRNRLLILLQDDATAFEVAARFVDNEEKYTVFERQLMKHMNGTIKERAASAADVASTLWAQCYAESEV